MPGAADRKTDSDEENPLPQMSKPAFQLDTAMKNLSHDMQGLANKLLQDFVPQSKRRLSQGGMSIITHIVQPLEKRVDIH